MGESSVEVAEVFDSTLQFPPLLAEHSAEVLGDLITASGGAHLRQLGCLIERQIESAKPEKQPESLNIARRVFAVPVVLPRRCWKDAATLIKADSVRRDTESPGEFTDSHEATLNPRAALMSATTPRISDMVNGREIFILFNLNPDGSEFDHASGVYRSWRKNRQPTPGSSEIGTDINRNFGYRWGTNPLNASPAGETYRGPSAWSTPEARAFRDFVESRVIGGVQQIRVHATFHQYGRIVLYPYGYTTTPVPSDMEADDHATLTAMAGEMARLSGYAAGQSSHPNINVGNQMDWMYATHRIMTFTFEMGDTFYMPDEAIPTETARNMDAAYYAIEQAASRANGDSRQEPVVLPDTAYVPGPTRLIYACVPQHQ